MFSISSNNITAAFAAVFSAAVFVIASVGPAANSAASTLV
jgi:hypothetical protein